MAVRIGTVLVKEGLITPHQLEEALKIQVIYGGRLGTNLVELGAIELDALAGALAKHFSVPVATAEMFESAEPAVLKLLTREQVERLECFPLHLDGRKLHLALEDPRDIAKFDEISFLTGLRIIPHLAPELRLVYYLEKVYGLQRKIRYIRLATELGDESARVERGPPAITPAPADDRRMTIEPIAADTEGTFEPPPERVDEALPEAILLPDDEPSVPVESAFAAGPTLEMPQPPRPAPVAKSTTPAAGPPPGWTGDSRTPARSVAPIAPPPAGTPPPHTPSVLAPMSLAEAIVNLDTAENRDHIAETILRCALRYFEETILFVVREGNATGWRAVGPHSSRVAVETVVIPLNAPSIFQGVYQSKVPFFGLVPDQPLNRKFFQLLRAPRPRFTMVLPLLIKDRLVNLLYTDNGPRDVPTIALPELTELLAHAARAYERIIKEAKKRMEL